MDNNTFEEISTVKQQITTEKSLMAFSSLTNEEVQKESLSQNAISYGNNHQTIALPALSEFQTENEQDIRKVQDLAKNSRFSVTPFVMSVKDRHTLGVEDPYESQSTLQELDDSVYERKQNCSIISSSDQFVIEYRKRSRDIIPSIDNYRTRYQSKNSAKSTTINMDGSSTSGSTNAQPAKARNSEKNVPEIVIEKVKFGWIEGVLIRNMMSIWGVMLFLRLSWVVAQAGIGETLVIIGISTFITLVTALSMSAISTNGEIGGGGTYFVMSRVLGPEFGGSIGIIFTIANAMDCSLNVVGFAQTVQDMMMKYGGIVIVDGEQNDIRIIGTITMIFICGVCGLGAQYETKMKNFMFVVMLASFANFLAGSIIGPQTETEQARGFIGFSMDLLSENWEPAYTITGGRLQNFISVFSVYFPASIGILAGANVSGDLKNPNTAIPKGTILAIILCSFSYAGIAIICAAVMARGATGQVTDLHNGTFLNCESKICNEGLYYNYQSMSLISAFPPLNYIGCIAATISSALSDFVSCPALLEVIADDKLYPYLMVGFWGKVQGKSRTPYRAFALTFVLSLAFVFIGHLDDIALLISNFFLATFALMNFSTFHVSLIKPIGWRPTFKYYNTWLSLLTCILTIVSMILISLPTAMITMAIVLFFYLVVLYRKPEVNWGSSTQAQTYRTALTSIQQLVHIKEHVKNYRPQILVLTGLPNTRPALVDFAYLICKNNSLMTCGNIIKEKLTWEARSQIQQKAYRYLRFTHIKGFCSVVDNSNLHTGVAAMLGLVGVGKIRPNILMMGYKNDWSTCDRDSMDQYMLAIHTAFEMNVGVAILRLQEGLDCSNILADIDSVILKSSSGIAQNLEKEARKRESSITRRFSLYSVNPDFRNSNPHSKNDLELIDESETITSVESSRRTVVLGITKNKKSKRSKKQAITFRDPEGNELPKGVMNKIILFQKKQKKDTIDVWWLSDDGGLTLLLPVIINTRSNWTETKLRIFCSASGVQELEKEQRGMAVLLSKFRIDYSDLVIISDIDDSPKKKTKQWFHRIIHDFLEPRTSESCITMEELEAFQYKTDRYLKLRELLLDHSSDSNLVVMTLPMPRIGQLTSPLYMAWLEALTANMPPFMLVRGNQTSVLTFYV